MRVVAAHHSAACHFAGENRFGLPDPALASAVAH
jgi:hypothetical protein